MLALFLFLFAAAPSSPVAQLQPVAVSVGGEPAFCGHVSFTPGYPQIGIDVGRGYAADQASLRLTVAGSNTLATNMSAPFGIVLMSQEAVNAMSQKQTVIYAYSAHNGKDTVTVTFPAPATLGCK